MYPLAPKFRVGHGRPGHPASSATVDSDELLRVVWVVISGIQKGVYLYAWGGSDSLGLLLSPLEIDPYPIFRNAKLVIFSFMRQGILCIIFSRARDS
jgi:hypothetical protein